MSVSCDLRSSLMNPRLSQLFKVGVDTLFHHCLTRKHGNGGTRHNMTADTFHVTHLCTSTDTSILTKPLFEIFASQFGLNLTVCRLRTKCSPKTSLLTFLPDLGRPAHPRIKNTKLMRRKDALPCQRLSAW